MDIGSDGSLCRITSKATAHNNAVIVVSESELEKSKGTAYKIVFINTIQNPHESSSELESDEEIDKKMPKMIQPSIGNEEKANATSDKETAVNEFKGKESSKANRGYNRYSSNNNFKNRRRNRPYRNHHNSSNKRNSYPKKNSSKIYSNNNSSVNIHPWINPLHSYSVSRMLSPVPPAIESHIPKRINCKSCAETMGIIGDRPYSHFPPPHPQFPSREPYVPDPNYWNDQTDINCWNNGPSIDYQRSIPTYRPVSKPNNFQHGKHFHQNRPWRRGNAHRQNETKDPSGENTGHYSYDHQTSM